MQSSREHTQVSSYSELSHSSSARQARRSKLTWLPSRRSEDAHLGAFVIRLSGQVRSGKLTDLKGLQECQRKRQVEPSRKISVRVQAGELNFRKFTHKYFFDGSLSHVASGLAS